MMQLLFSKLKKMNTLYELPENSKDFPSSCFHENVDKPFFPPGVKAFGVQP